MNIVKTVDEQSSFHLFTNVMNKLSIPRQQFSLCLRSRRHSILAATLLINTARNLSIFLPHQKHNHSISNATWIQQVSLRLQRAHDTGVRIKFTAVKLSTFGA
jgi:hypothetical protein